MFMLTISKSVCIQNMGFKTESCNCIMQLYLVMFGYLLENT